MDGLGAWDRLGTAGRLGPQLDLGQGFNRVGAGEASPDAVGKELPIPLLVDSTEASH